MANPFAGLLTGGGANTPGNISGLSGAADRLKSDAKAQSDAKIAKDQAARRKKSVDWINAQKGAGAVKEAGTFDNIPVVGKPLSLASDFATGLAKSTAKGVLGDSSAGETSKAIQQIKSGQKVSADQAGHSQSLKDEAIGALEARLMLAGGGGLAKDAATGAGSKLLAYAKAGNTFGKYGAAASGLDTLTDVNTKGKSASDIAKSTAINTGIGYAGGFGFGAGAHGVGAIIKGGAAKAMANAEDRQAQKAASAQFLADSKASAIDPARTLGPGEIPKPLELGAGKPGNNSTAVIPGKPAAPKTLSVTKEEYSQRFGDMSKEYDRQMKLAEKQPTPIRQRIAADQVHEHFSQQLDQLDHEFKNGKTNPDISPAVPDKTVQTGFTLEAPGKAKDATAPNIINKDLTKRVTQIENIVQDAQNGGTHRTPEELRSLLRERRDALAVLNGDKTYADVYHPAVAANNAIPSTEGKMARVDALTSYEGAPDKGRVAEYKKLIENGHDVGALKVTPDSSGNLGIADGKHRYEAYRQLGHEHVPVEMISKDPANTPISGAIAHNVDPSVFKKEPTVADLATGNRPEDTLQTRFEDAVNKGDREAAQKVVDEISSPELKNPIQSVLDRTLPPGEKTRGFVDTVKNSPKTSPEVAAGVEGTYSPISNKETLAAADKVIAKDFEGSVERAKTSDDYSKETQAQSLRLIDHLQNMGRYGDAIDIVEKTAERATKGGQSTQILAAYNRLTPEGILQAAQREVTKLQKTNPEKYKNLKLSVDQIDNLRQMAKDVQAMPPGEEKLQATRKLVEEIQRVAPSTRVQKFVTLWKAGLLTGIKGAVFGNAVGNNSRLLLTKLSDVPATAIDSVIGLATGRRSRTLTLKGLASGFKEGLQVGLKALKEGHGAEQEATKLDYKKVYFSRSPLGKAAQKYTDTVFNFYSAADRPNFYAALRNTLQDLAKTEAKNAGLSGKAASKYTDKIIASPPDNIIQQAVKEAEGTVFQDKNALGAVLSGAKGRAAGTILEAPTEMLLPFTGVPSSIASAVYHYSPPAGVVAALKAIKQVAGGEFDQAAQRKLTSALGTSITGTGLMYLGSKLTETGQMTLGYPTDPNERARWEQDGKQPYSVLVGGKWRSLNYAGPISAVMAIGGEIARARMAGQDLVSGTTSAVAGGAKAILGGSPLQGVQSGLDAIADPQGSGKAFFNNLAGSVVPTLVKDAAVATDTVQRKASNPLQAIESRIPGARQQVPTKPGDDGKPLPRPNSAIGSVVDPFKSSQSTNSPEKNVATDEFFGLYKKANSDKTKVNAEVTSLVRQGNYQQARRKADEYNANLGGRFDGFNKKYAGSDLVEQDWEDQMDGLKINVSDRALKQREVKKKK